MNKKGDLNYVPCMKRFPRQHPEMDVPPKVEEVILEDFTVLPLAEKKINEYTRKKHYSFLRNQYLACKWDEFKDDRTRALKTFEFPKITDFHFYLCDTRYIPAQSLDAVESWRRNLTPGPGVDRLGALPIPEELHVREDFGLHKTINQKQKTIKPLKRKTWPRGHFHWVN